MSSELRRKVALAYCASVAVFLVLLLVGMFLELPFLTQDSMFLKGLYPLASAIPAIAGIYFAITERSPMRPVYAAFAVAMTLSAAGAAGTVFSPSEFPVVFDYINIAVYCFGAIGLLFASANRSFTYILDGLIITSSLLFVTWAVLLRPVLGAFDGDYLTAAVSLAAPSFDVMLLSASLLTLLRGTSMISRNALIAFGLGTAFDAVSLTNWAYFGRSIPIPEMTIFFWVASGLSLAACALFPPNVDKVRLKPVTFKFMLLPYPAVFLAIAFGIYMTITTDELRRDVFVPAGIAGLCLIVRQLLAGFENVKLARTLEVAVQQLRVREIELSHLALHDPLTSLPNRRFIDQRLSSDSTLSDVEYVVLLLDLDNFKAVNDQLGHEAGDLLLVRVANALSECIRANDVVARLGGDEFVVILINSNEQAALEVASRIRKRLNPTALNVGPLVDVKVGASIGLAKGRGMASLGTVMRNADTAMYERKRSAQKGGLAIFNS